MSVISVGCVGGSTSPLHRHLRMVHPDAMSAPETIEHSNKQEELVNGVCSLLTSGLLSFKTVSSPEMQAVFRAAGMTVPSSPTLKLNVLQMAERVRQKVMARVESEKVVSISCDVYTAPTSDPVRFLGRIHSPIFSTW